jgi:hypothetical protein
MQQPSKEFEELDSYEINNEIMVKRKMMKIIQSCNVKIKK